MGNSICINTAPQTHISSHFHIKKILPKENMKKFQDNIDISKKIQQKSQSNAFSLPQHKNLQENQNPQSSKQFKQPSLRSTRQTDYSSRTPKKSFTNAIKQLTTNNNQNIHFQYQSLHKNHNIYQNKISVPFSVIYLNLSKKIINAINQSHSTFFKKYQNDSDSFKLLPNGCYGHILTENYGIFINSNYFYQGQFKINQKRQFIPFSKGTYISQNGKYVGQFEGGKPNGKGKYYEYGQVFNQSNKNDDDFIMTFKSQNSLISDATDFQKQTNSTIYQGQWKDGQFLSGEIHSSEYIYEGNLKNGKPQGQGKLMLKKSQVTYKGGFKDGMFDGRYCTYESPNFVYQGDFIRGKKQGLGILTKKIAITKNNNPKTKYFGEERYEGFWKEDLLIYEQYVGDRGKK